jgi:hypothetical protein
VEPRALDPTPLAPGATPRTDGRSRLPLRVAASRIGIPVRVLEQAAKLGDLRVVYLGPARVACTAPAWLADWVARTSR